jgi:hypothetical protein
MVIEMRFARGYFMRQKLGRVRLIKHLKFYPLKAKTMRLVLTMTAFLVILSACANVPAQEAKVSSQEWQDKFDLNNRKLNHTGETTYFILKPGFQITLASQNEQLTITVLDETKEFDGITARLIEEREEKNGELSEISRNFYAIDQKTGDVFYFGEEVDFYGAGVITSHSGAWFAYENGNQPGLIMPGDPVVGMKYYQELAPAVAMDRAKVVSISETFTTEVGEFKNCLVTQESSKLQPTVIEHKTYCPGIGIVQDQSLILVDYRQQ